MFTMEFFVNFAISIKMVHVNKLCKLNGTFMNVIALKHILSFVVGSYGMRGGIETPLYALKSICDKRLPLRLPFTPFADGIAFI